MNINANLLLLGATPVFRIYQKRTTFFSNNNIRAGGK